MKLFFISFYKQATTKEMCGYCSDLRLFLCIALRKLRLLQYSLLIPSYIKAFTISLNNIVITKTRFDCKTICDFNELLFYVSFSRNL